MPCKRIALTCTTCVRTFHYVHLRSIMLNEIDVDGVEIGERAFTEFRDREMFLGLSGLTEILDGPQGPQRGIEEGEEIRDKDVIKEQGEIAVGLLIAWYAVSPASV